MAVIPAYGRDYKNAEEAQEAFLSGKDFILADISDPYDGAYCSCRDFKDQIIEVRYRKKSRLVMVKV